MSWVDGVRHRLRTLLRPRDYDAEIEEEMRFHLELDAMQQGDGTAAVRRFGNRTYYKEETRGLTWLGSLDVLRQDLTYVWRTMRRAPGLTMTIVLTLALGIGVNAAVFTVLDRLYLRVPGAVSEPDALRRYWVEHFNTGGGEPFTSTHMNYPMYAAIAAASGDSSGVALFATDFSLRQGPHPRDPKIRGVYATANYFPVLGVRPALGRFFSPDEDRLGAPAHVAVVSHRFWTNRLGADSAILGQPLLVHRDRYTIIGVADPAFTGLDLQAVDVWMPLASMPPPPWIQGNWWESPNIYSMQAIQRLEDPAHAATVAARATERIRAYNRATYAVRPDTQMNVFLGSIIEARGPGTPGQELVISTRLAGVAILVLVIACANVINLLLARAMRRRREIALRLALGVSRARLVRLLTTETLVIAMIGGVAALIAATWGGSMLRSLLLPEIEWHDSVVDWRVVAFTTAVTIVAGLVAGLWPALQAGRADVSRALKAGGRQSDRHRTHLRGGLVVTQTALSVALLVGATLFVRSLHNVRSLDIGFDAGRLLFSELEFPVGESPPAAVIAAALLEVEQRLAGRPGIESVARSTLAPMRGFSFVPFYSGSDSAGSFVDNMPSMSRVSPGYFRTVGIQLLQGTGFTETRAASREVVVNEAMAQLLWPEQAALGRCLRFVSRDSTCHIVAGVVENVRRSRVIEESPVPQFYLPLGSTPDGAGMGRSLIVRAGRNATTPAAAELRDALRHAFPTADVDVVRMTENLEPEYRPWRLGATLFTGIGVLALIVTIVGIFSTVSYDVSQRTHEFGVRVALGARLGDVLRQVLGEGVRVLAVGVALGLALSLAAGRLVEALLYGVEPHDPLVMAIVAATLLIVGVSAALLPAWRAARADPTIALRAD